MGTLVHQLQHMRSVPMTVFHDRPVKMLLGTWNFSASYAAGGEVFTPPVGMFTQIHGVLFFDNVNANYAKYDPATGKVQAIVRTTGVELAAAADVSADDYNFVIYGTGPR